MDFITTGNMPATNECTTTFFDYDKERLNSLEKRLNSLEEDFSKLLCYVQNIDKRVK